MKFHIQIKFRAFGVTFGTLDQDIDGTATLNAALAAILSVLSKTIPAVGLVNPASLLSQITIPPHVIYNDRGVLLEIVAG
jgi:hypothetical protein